MCHETTVRGWAQLESSDTLGVECGITQWSSKAFNQPVFVSFAVWTTPLVVVRLCPSQETSIWERTRPNEDL